MSLFFLLRKLPSEKWMHADFGPASDPPFLRLQWRGNDQIPFQAKLILRYLKRSLKGIVELDWDWEYGSDADPQSQEGAVFHARKSLEKVSIAVVKESDSVLLVDKIKDIYASDLVRDLQLGNFDAIQYLERTWLQSSKLRNLLGSMILEKYLLQPSAYLASGILRLRFTPALEELKRLSSSDMETTKLITQLKELFEANEN
jgi:hypothetical protein